MTVNSPLSSSPRLAGSAGHVYVLDDDEQLCQSLAWLLGSVHIRTECFTDADSFLAAFDPDRPACLVLDVRMPHMGGFQVQEFLAARNAVLPVVFVSAHGDIRMSVRALQQGRWIFWRSPTAHSTCWRPCRTPCPWPAIGTPSRPSGVR
ncbi:response regulator [Streptomyces sp. FXJ1.4098]|nr:response regulator [Streptomyces sp. FXJ1.4098]